MSAVSEQFKLCPEISSIGRKLNCPKVLNSAFTLPTEMTRSYFRPTHPYLLWHAAPPSYGWQVQLCAENALIKEMPFLKLVTCSWKSQWERKESLLGREGWAQGHHHKLGFLMCKESRKKREMQGGLWKGKKVQEGIKRGIKTKTKKASKKERRKRRWNVKGDLVFSFC